MNLRILGWWGLFALSDATVYYVDHADCIYCVKMYGTEEVKSGFLSRLKEKQIGPGIVFWEVIKEQVALGTLFGNGTPEACFTCEDVGYLKKRIVIPKYYTESDIRYCYGFDLDDIKLYNDFRLMCTGGPVESTRTRAKSYSAKFTTETCKKIARELSESNPLTLKQEREILNEYQPKACGRRRGIFFVNVPKKYAFLEATLEYETMRKLYDQYTAEDTEFKLVDGWQEDVLGLALNYATLESEAYRMWQKNEVDRRCWTKKFDRNGNFGKVGVREIRNILDSILEGKEVYETLGKVMNLVTTMVDTIYNVEKGENDHRKSENRANDAEYIRGQVQEALNPIIDKLSAETSKIVPFVIRKTHLTSVDIFEPLPTTMYIVNWTSIEDIGHPVYYKKLLEDRKSETDYDYDPDVYYMDHTDCIECLNKYGTTAAKKGLKTYLENHYDGRGFVVWELMQTQASSSALITHDAPKTACRTCDNLKYLEKRIEVEQYYTESDIRYCYQLGGGQLDFSKGPVQKAWSDIQSIQLPESSARIRVCQWIEKAKDRKDHFEALRKEKIYLHEYDDAPTESRVEPIFVRYMEAKYISLQATLEYQALHRLYDGATNREFGDREFDLPLRLNTGIEQLGLNFAVLKLFWYKIWQDSEVLQHRLRNFKAAEKVDTEGDTEIREFLQKHGNYMGENVFIKCEEAMGHVDAMVQCIDGENFSGEAKVIKTALDKKLNPIFLQLKEIRGNLIFYEKLSFMQSDTHYYKRTKYRLADVEDFPDFLSKVTGKPLVV